MNRLRLLAQRVVMAATRKGVTIGTAESLTGGMIASAIAGVPGASKALMGGIVSYDPGVKRWLLDVPQDVIDGVGVVSGPCARQMAMGARERLRVDIAVSATGLAGPCGGTPETPVGTVYLGIAGDRPPRVERKNFRGGRQSIRRKAALTALQMILDELNSYP